MSPVALGLGHEEDTTCTPLPQSQALPVHSPWHDVCVKCGGWVRAPLPPAALGLGLMALLLWDQPCCAFPVGPGDGSPSFPLLLAQGCHCTISSKISYLPCSSGVLTLSTLFLRTWIEPTCTPWLQAHTCWDTLPRTIHLHP